MGLILIEEELELFKLKEINTENDFNLNTLYDPLLDIQGQIKNIYKASKKQVLTLDVIKEQVVQKNIEINNLNKELAYIKEIDSRIIKKVIGIVDQIYNISEYTIKSKNIKLQENLDSMIKLIKKDLGEIGIEEIPTIGELFNSQIHECVEAMEDKSKLKYEIVGVVKRGYKFNGKVIRPAYVIAVK